MGQAIAGILFHGQAGPHGIALDFREETHAYRAGEWHTNHQHEDTDKQHHHGVTVQQSEVDHRLVKALAKPLQASVTAVLDLGPATRQRVLGTVAMGVQVGQVRWQDQFGFHQRQQQTNGYDAGKLAVNFAHAAFNIGQCAKRRHRGQYPEQGRYCHAHGAAYGVVNGVAVTTAFGINTFADHHSVVDHDPQRHDKTEGGEVVKRQARPVITHEIQGAEENKRQTGSHPESHFQVQEQSQQQEHQQDAGGGVFHQQFQSALNRFTAVVPGFQLHRLRQTAIVDPLLHHRLSRHHGVGNVVLTGGDHLQGNAVFALKARQHRAAVVVGITNTGNIAQQQLLAGLQADQRNTGKIGGFISLFRSLQLQIQLLAFQHRRHAGG